MSSINKTKMGVENTHYSYTDKNGNRVSIPNGKSDAFYLGISNLRDVYGDGNIVHRGVLKVCPQGINSDGSFKDDLMENASHSLVMFEYSDFIKNGEIDESIKCRNNVLVDANFFAENIGIDGGEADTYAIGTKDAFYNALYSKWIIGSGINLFLSPADEPRWGRITINNDGYMYPNYEGGGGYSLGTKTYPFHTLYLKGGVQQVSDARQKEDIEYIGKMKNSLTTLDCLKFIKDDLKLATYKMKSEKEENKQVGFLAQDIMNTKVGELIVEKSEKEEDTISYSLSTYVNVLAGALQEAIKKIDDLENKLK